MTRANPVTLLGSKGAPREQGRVVVGVEQRQQLGEVEVGRRSRAVGGTKRELQLCALGNGLRAWAQGGERWGWLGGVGWGWGVGEGVEGGAACAMCSSGHAGRNAAVALLPPPPDPLALVQSLGVSVMRVPLGDALASGPQVKLSAKSNESSQLRMS